MKLYHGSTFIVDKPLISYGRDNLDFGKGFYTTNMQNQAENGYNVLFLLAKKVSLIFTTMMILIFKKNTAIRNFQNTMKNGSILFLLAVAVQKIIQNMTL